MNHVLRKCIMLIGGGKKRFISNDGFVYSASISFHVILAVVPFLFFLVFLSGLFVTDVIAEQKKINDVLETFFPFSSSFILDNFRLLYDKRATLGIIGLVTLFLTTFSLTNTVHVSLAAMLTSGRGKNFLKTFISHSIAIVFFPILLLLVFSTSSLISFFMRIASFIETPFLRLIFDESIILLSKAIPLFLFMGATIMIYRHLSPIHIPRHLAATGGIFFTLSTYLLNKGIIFYVVKVSKLSMIYGSIFGVICFIIATYIFASVFLFTACVIGEYLKGKIKI